MTHRWPAGSTVVRRDVFRGKVVMAVPCRVVEHTDDLLAVARWPGVVGLWDKPWVDWLQSRDDALRGRIVEELAAGTWELVPWTWRDTTKLDLLIPGAYFSVSLFFGADGTARGWYVDFARPYQPTTIGVDSLDLLLDLVVEPDRSYRWKDEAEYAHARRLGIVSDTEHARVWQARDEVLDLLERKAGPFDDRWHTWELDPSWPLPSLPADVLTAQ